MRLPALLLASIATLVPICGCTPARDPFEPVSQGQLRILASFAPIYCFAANVAGEHGKVLCLLTTEGPHEYQATHLDTIKIAKADVFFINGQGIDEFVTKPVADVRKKSALFEVGALPDDMLIHLGEGEHHVHADGTKCTHGDHDPHLWLGPIHAQKMVARIAKKLGDMRPEHKSAFEANAAAYAKELQALHAYGLEKFKAKKNRKVIVTHDFLRYFAQAHDLEIVGNIQPNPGQEADAGQLAKLAKLCREQEVRAIIVEPQYLKASGAAQTLRQQLERQGLTGVQLVEFDPMETVDPGPDGRPDPAFYLSRMRKNIDNLVKALP